MAPPSLEVEVVGDVPDVTSEELGAAISRLQAKNVAPGPDGIPGRVWVLALDALEPRLRAMFSACLAQAIIPQRWKTGRLVLLRKEGRPVDSPSAYRPIVLLDEVGKLFERVVAGRIVEHLQSVGPDLADTQFGFRRGRSTVHAVLRVKSLAQDAVSRGEVVLAVSLDIANAFNTLPWACIREALRFHGVPLYLRRVIGAYLSERGVTYPCQNGQGQLDVTCGVPQGSVLGPLLWNIGYDWVLRGSNLRGVEVTCYADDTLVTARGANFRRAAILATAGTAHVVGRIRRLGLEVALNKSEALCFHGPRNAPPADAHIVVSGVRIGVESTMRYLGLVLDRRWDFCAHFERLGPRVTRAAAALGRLLPNIGGPNDSCRRLYAGVVRSMALYGAPVWADTLNRRSVALLRRPQRVLATRAIRGYRTISGEAACLLACSLPWDLDAGILASLYTWREEARARGHLLAPEELGGRRRVLRQRAVQEWSQRLEHPSAGQRTVEAIRPILHEWLDRRHGSLTFRATQILSGHGCFGRYLWRVAGREPSAICHHCDGCAEERAQHTLEECPAWAVQRQELCAIVGDDLSLPAVVRAMVDSEGSWDAFIAFSEDVMSHKEAAERDREAIADLAIRRRRLGRRRRAYARNLPP